MRQAIGISLFHKRGGERNKRRSVILILILNSNDSPTKKADGMSLFLLYVPAMVVVILTRPAAVPIWFTVDGYLDVT